MSTDDQTQPPAEDAENISFSATELDDIVNSAEITEEKLANDDLEEYGVWVKVGPEDVPESTDAMPTADGHAPLTDLDEAEEDFLTEEEESLLGELGDVDAAVESTVGDDVMLGADDELDLDIPDVEDLVEGEEREEEPEFDTDFAPNEVESAAAGESTISDATFADDNDDIEVALTDDALTDEALTEDIEVALTDESSTDSSELGDLADLGDPSAPSRDTGNGDTASLLAKMERELLAIMEEITDVKRELTELRKSGISSAESKEETTGFFDGDDDETIALTGDELDNILSSADITEEIAEADAGPAALDVDAATDISVMAEPAADLDLDLSLDSGPDAIDGDGGAPAAAEADLEIGDIGDEGEGDGAGSLIDGDDLLSGDSVDASVSAAAEASDAAPPAVEELSLDLDEGDADDLLLEEEPAAAVADDLILEEEPAAADAGDLILEEEPAAADAGDLILEEEPAAAEPEELVLEEDLSIGDTTAAADAASESNDLEQEIASGEEALELVEELEESGPEIELEQESRSAEGEDVELNMDEDAQPLELVDDQPLELEGGAEDEDGALLDIEEVGDEASTDISDELPDEHRGDAGTITLEGADAAVPDDLKQDIKSVLAYLDQLLDALPEDKIEEFAQSEHFGVYKKLFEELGLED